MTFLTIDAKFNIVGSYNLSTLISSSMKHNGMNIKLKNWKKRKGWKTKEKKFGFYAMPKGSLV
jgi:hypothetical protein